MVTYFLGFKLNGDLETGARQIEKMAKTSGFRVEGLYDFVVFLKDADKLKMLETIKKLSTINEVKVVLVLEIIE